MVNQDLILNEDSIVSTIAKSKIYLEVKTKMTNKEKKAQRKAEAEAKRKAEAAAKQTANTSEAAAAEAAPKDEATLKAEAEAAQIAQRNTDNASKINATTLGRIANDMRIAESDLEKHTILTIAARKYHTSTIALSSVVEPYLNKVSEEGKLVTRKAALDRVQALAFVDCQHRNALLAMDIDSMSEAQKTHYLKSAQDAATKLVNALHSNEGTTSATQGYAYFVHSPLKDLFTDEEITLAEFYLVSTGWDNKRSYPYYGVRMTPSDNPKNTREIQYTRPVPVELLTDEVTEAVSSEVSES